MGGWVDQVKLMVGGIAAAALLAGVGLQFSVTPTYTLITRPTPTPTPVPYTFGDPRLNTRTTTLAQAQAAATFKILRPVGGVSREPQAVTVSEAGRDVISVRQTYALTPTVGTAPVSVWVTQAHGGSFQPPNTFGRQAVTNTVTLAMGDGRQQPATLSRSSFGVTLSWTDSNGYFNLRVPVADYPTERIVELATSLR